MIIRNKIILILGRPGEGKTYFATFLASFYPRIYSNIEITQNGNKMTHYIKNLEDVNNIAFSEEKGVVLLDEGGININARNSQSSENKEFGQLAMLGRKKNVDIIVCAQLGRMIDVYFRELANYIFEMHAWFEARDYLMFETKIYHGGSGDRIIKVARLDLFNFTKLTGISYNTLDSSRIDMSKPTRADTPPPGQGEKEWEKAKVYRNNSPEFTTDSSPSLTFTKENANFDL